MKTNEKQQKTRKYKQEIENLKLDIIDAQEEYNQIYNNLMKCTQLLKESTNYTNGKLKYDSNMLSGLLIKLYQFDL